MSTSAPPSSPGAYGRQLAILLVLVSLLMLLHSVAEPRDGLDATTLLAFGFVVLASYTIGDLVGALRLPHITGYLLAGLAFGPSVPDLITSSGLGTPMPPLDHGVLSHDVIEVLSILDTLAVALIAITAGGELRLETLRRGLRAIGAILTGQLVFALLLVTSFIWFFLSHPAGAALTLSTAEGVSVALVVASISLATSPAATVAVINEAGAEGPMSRTVLSTVVLKDVLVVVLFSLTSLLASQVFGFAGQGDFGLFLLVHIGGSLVAGVVVGLGFALYLKLVGHEVLLMIVAVVYAATLAANSLHLDPVLLFIAAGFTVSNNPLFRQGDRFIHNVEQLSTPVYVVFFTLAGAKLHLDELQAVLPWALALVAVRGAVLWLGGAIGGRIGRADPATQKHGWLGFVSQAGVAISLAGILGQNFGALGASLQTLVIAGVAINELIGPVLLKIALNLAGEGTPAPGVEDRAAPSPSPAPPSRKDDEGALAPWPEGGHDEPNLWGARPTSSTPEVNALLVELRGDLQGVVDDLERGALARFRRDAASYLQELGQEFLRNHRRLRVQQRSESEAPSEAVLAEESVLAERWRGVVLGRAARLTHHPWSPLRVIETVDRLAASQPESVRVQWEPESFLPRVDDGPWLGTRRLLLRGRRATARLFGRPVGTRDLRFRNLAQYHLSGSLPAELESAAALMVEAESHLANRTRSLFEGIVVNYDRLLGELPETPTRDLNEPMRTIRRQAEEEIELAHQELDRMVRSVRRRVEASLAEAFRSIHSEVATFGTFDLPERRRRSSRLFRRRTQALEVTLRAKYEGVHRVLAAGYTRVGLELELAGLQARVKALLAQHATALERDVRGRSFVQAERLSVALSETHSQFQTALEGSEVTGERLATQLRECSEPLEKTAAEATRAALQLRDQLAAEATIGPLLDALQRASQQLTDHYEIPLGRMHRGEHRLPDPIPVLEVSFREIVTTHLDAELAPRLFGLLRDAAAQVGPYVNSLQELERNVAFNFELASAELDLVHDEIVSDKTRALLVEMVLGGLDRNRHLAAEHAKLCRPWAEELGQGIREGVLEGLETLRHQVVEGDLTQAKVLALQRRAAGHAFIRRAERLPSYVHRSATTLRETFRSFVGYERLDAWRRALGLPPPATTVPHAEGFAPPAAGSELPLVYRRLFAAETLEAADVLTGREVEIERANRALSGAATGALRSVALIGLDGVGKGALSKAIVRSRPWKHVRRIDLTGPVNLDDVARWFRETSEGHLFVISDFHWMVAMKRGGFAPLRRFVEGVIADAGRNAWLLHADRLVWEYGCRIAPLADAFPEVVEVNALGPEELEAALLARHALSGLGLSFHPEDSDHSAPGDDALVRGAARLRRPYTQFFRSLHTASGGLIRDALRLWIASVSSVDEAGEYVHFGRVPRSPIAALRRLPEEVLVNLYQVARQGWMDASVQASLFRVDHTTAEAQLSRLRHLGLLERDHEAYRIASHLRGPVYRVLHERGWVP